MSELNVCLHANRVGSLSLARGQLSFRYRQSWLDNPKAVPLSLSLPLVAEPFDDQTSAAFFAGLLPEGKIRELLAKKLGLSPGNDFSLLNEIGGECAGAVSLFEPGVASNDTAESGQDVSWLDEQAVINVFDQLPRSPMLAGAEEHRLSLAGAQSKLPVVFDGQRIGLPSRNTPSTHIAKPAIDNTEDSVANEAFCLALARLLKLPAAGSMIMSFGDHRILLVERYDRIKSRNGSNSRLHQEDFCQALGILPTMKYQNEGGPDLSDCFALIRRATRPSAPHIIKFFDYVVFNVLTGNNDAHGKNYSLLYKGEQTHLAPLYDTLCTEVYAELSDKMSMKMGSQYRFDQVRLRHWEQFAEAAGLGVPQSKKRLSELAESLQIAARQLQSEPEFANLAIVEKIIQIIEARVDRVIGYLQV